jgi:hypothetical protein
MKALEIISHIFLNTIFYNIIINCAFVQYKYAPLMWVIIPLFSAWLAGYECCLLIATYRKNHTD